MTGLYMNQVPVICDVITYTVTVSFCHSTWIRYQSSVMSTLILLLFLSVTLQESGTSHLWCQHLYSYCYFLSLYMNQVPVICDVITYTLTVSFCHYKNQVPVICDVNTYTVTVSFCHFTRIRYQSSVMSTLILLLFLSVTLQESGTSHLWCQHLYFYCFFLSLYKNQVTVICDAYRVTERNSKSISVDITDDCYLILVKWQKETVTV
jgi:hypothetical protein